MTQEQQDKMVQMEELARSQCDAIKERKIAAREKRAERETSRSTVPYFAALKMAAKPPAKPQLHRRSCSTCDAEFGARDEATLNRIFEEHSKACAERLQKRNEHHLNACEATAEKASRAWKRVDVLQRSVDQAKEALKRKEEAIEEEKRRKRVQQGKKQKNIKKHPYSLPVEQSEQSEEVQSTIQGCIQRLRDAEKELRAGKQRANFREETAEIARASAAGQEHKSVQRRAAIKQQLNRQKKQHNYRKEHKRMSKEVRASEKTEKSKKKGERRNGADSKMHRASYE